MNKTITCDCGYIAPYNSYMKAHYCGTCGFYQKDKHTNFEKIKDMTVEEMAEFLDRVRYDYCTTCCNNLNNCMRNNAIEPICKNHFINWLESEIKN